MEKLPDNEQDDKYSKLSNGDLMEAYLNERNIIYSMGGEPNEGDFYSKSGEINKSITKHVLDIDLIKEEMKRRNLDFF